LNYIIVLRIAASSPVDYIEDLLRKDLGGDTEGKLLARRLGGFSRARITFYGKKTGVSEDGRERKTQSTSSVFGV